MAFSNLIGEPDTIVTRAQKRQEKIGKLYKEYRDEFYEDNIPTSLYGFFQEVLAGMPVDHIGHAEDRDIEVLSLFEHALDDLYGTSKKYI